MANIAVYYWHRFLGQAYIGKDYSAILSGVAFTGIGIHFHLASRLSAWPDDVSVLTLIISLGLLLQYVKTKQALLPTIYCLRYPLFFIFTSASTSVYVRDI